MKYSEFKREVEKLGFTHNRRCEEIVVKVDGETVMGVSTSRKYIVDNEWKKYQELNETTQEQLFDLAYKLAKTPLAEREEEKKYHLKLELPIPLEDSSMHWLNQKVGASKYHFGSQENIRDYKTIFTESEVAQMDLTGLKLIEVKDE